MYMCSSLKRGLQRYLFYFSIWCIIVVGCLQKNSTSESEAAGITDLDLKLGSLDSEIVLHPDQADLYRSRANIYQEKGQWENAVNDLERTVSIEPTDIDSWHLMADILLESFQSRRALETMTAVASKYPDSLNTWLKLSEFQLILKRYSDGLQTLQTIQEKYPFESEIFFMKGMILKETGNLKAAWREFQLATREDPGFMDAWINAGQVLELLNDTGAIRCYQTALQISPGNVRVMHALAQYYSNHDETEKAISQYRELIRIDPGYTFAYYNMGLIYLDLDSLDKAFNHFNIVINVDPSFASGYYYRGLVSELLSNFRSAESDFNQAVNLNAEDASFREAQNRIRYKIGR